MRKLLLASVAALPLLIAPAAVRADLPVVDASSIAKQLQQIGLTTEEIGHIIDVYNETVQVFNMATNIWNSVAEIVRADQWASGLNSPAGRNPLEYMAAQHPGYVGGFTDPSGLQFGGTFVTQNTVGGNIGVYQGGDFVGAEIQKAIWSLSSMQAVSTNHLQAIETRILALGDLFAHLGSIGTIQETASLSARLNNEREYALSQVTQGQQAMASAQLNVSVLKYNQIQWQYQDEQNGIALACQNLAASPNAFSIPDCAAAGSGGAAGNAAVAAATPGGLTQ